MKKNHFNQTITSGNISKKEWEKPRIEQLDVKKTAGGVGTANENAHTPGS